MLCKLYRGFLFILYTLAIYLSSVIIGTIITLFYYGFEGAYHYWVLAKRALYEIILSFPKLLSNLSIRDIMDVTIILFILVFIAGYILPFILWFIKPSVLKAWSISLQGLFFGFGAFSFINPASLAPNIERISPSAMGLFIFLIICLFYSIIYFGGEYQKKRFPNNKFANKIRYLLAWPCLHR